MMDQLPQPGLPLTLLAFLVVIGLLVTVHEFGHYLVGRLFGVRALTFAIGFGREIFGWTDKRGTRWKIGLIPMGGYVRFLGDMNAASLPDHGAKLSAAEKEQAFPFKPLWQRALIVAAGPGVNFLFAILLLAILFSTVGRMTIPPIVDQIAPDSAAERAGLMVGDRIVEVAGRSVNSFEELATVIIMYPERTLTVVVERSGRTLDLQATPTRVKQEDRFGNRLDIGRLGVISTQQKFEKLGPLQAVGAAVQQTAFLTVTSFHGLKDIILGVRPISDLSGPIRIAKFSGEAAVAGWVTFVTFIALVSIAIGFANLLPIPVLDGGHLALYAVEAVRGRPVSMRSQELAFMAGFAALVSLFLVVSWNDATAVGLINSLTGMLG